MIRVIGKPSRVKDRIGIAVLAGTALLYAFQGTGGERTEACLGCETLEVGPSAAPFAPPVEPESLISSEPKDAAMDGVVDSAPPAPPMIPASHLLQKTDLQREAH